MNVNTKFYQTFVRPDESTKKEEYNVDALCVKAWLLGGGDSGGARLSLSEVTELLYLRTWPRRFL